MKRTLTAIAVLLLVAAAHAVGPVGAWTGRFVPKVPTLPPGAPAAQRAKLAADLATIKTGRLHLVMKPDHTYTMHIVGLPMLGKPDSAGTWTQSGAFVDMVETGKAKGTRPLHLAYTEKRMSLGLGNAQFVFVR